jgi:hypothetical protein
MLCQTYSILHNILHIQFECEESFVGLTVFYKMFLTFNLNMKIFCKIMSVPQNIIMALNNVMTCAIDSLVKRKRTKSLCPGWKWRPRSHAHSFDPYGALSTPWTRDLLMCIILFSMAFLIWCTCAWEQIIDLEQLINIMIYGHGSTTCYVIWRWRPWELHSLLCLVSLTIWSYTMPCLF